MRSKPKCLVPAAHESLLVFAPASPRVVARKWCAFLWLLHCTSTTLRPRSAGTCFANLRSREDWGHESGAAPRVHDARVRVRHRALSRTRHQPRIDLRRGKGRHVRTARASSESHDCSRAPHNSRRESDVRPGVLIPLRLAPLAQGRPVRLAPLAQGRPIRLAPLAQGRQ
jgi:hypothetical protein